MSERVEKLIKEENNQILQMIHNDEAIYVVAQYYIDDETGERIYDWESMKYDFETSMQNLISLNKQAGRDIAGEMCDDLLKMVKKNEN